MSQIKSLLDEYGVIHEAMKILPDDIKIDFLEALAIMSATERELFLKQDCTKLSAVIFFFFDAIVVFRNKKLFFIAN